MKISIVIPVYNAEKTIEKCIISVLQSVSERMEIIIVDDGSTDGTAEVCKRYVNKYHNIIYIYQVHAGVSSARMKGVLSACGKYISFVDADDWCEKNRYFVMNELIDKCQADVYFFGAYMYKDGISKKIYNCSMDEGLYNISELKETYLYPLFGRLCDDKKESSGYLWNTLILKKYLVSQQMPDDIDLMEDEIVLIQVLLKAINIYVCKKCLYYYDKTERNSLSRKKGYWTNFWQKILKVYYFKDNLINNPRLQYEECKKRLATFLIHNYLRSISNETYYNNLSNIKERLNIIYTLDKQAVIECISYYDKNDFSKYERILLWLQIHNLGILCYLYYLIKYDRMKKFKVRKPRERH